MEDKESKLAKLKLWLDFWKFFLSTVVIGFSTTIINGQVQWYQLRQEREKREQEYLAKFIDQALDDSLDKRLRFAQYFSHLNLTKDAKERWGKYYTELTLEASNQEVQYRSLNERREVLLTKEKLSSEEDSELKRIELLIQELEKELPDTRYIQFQWEPDLVGKQITEGASFTWAEATKDGSRIPENSEVAENIKKMAIELEKIQKQLGAPIRVTSWYRDPETNRKIGGSEESTHIEGHGVDFYVEGYTVEALAEALAWWPGTMNQGRGYIHLDLNPGKKRAILFPTNN